MTDETDLDPAGLDPVDATLDELFAPLAGEDRWVLGQLGQSLDGRIATESGDSHYINGPEDLRRLHRARALADAVVVGAGTVASDDPRLTVRRVEGQDPVRVVLDARDRLTADRTVFTSCPPATLWLIGPDGDPARHPACMAERVRLRTRQDGRFEPADILTFLAERGLNRVLVEGGGLTVSSFLRADALDRLHISVAPLLIGSGRPAITLPPVTALSRARRPAVRHFHLGRDVLFDLDPRSDSPPSR